MYHDHKPAHFLVHIRSVVHVVVDMVRDMLEMLEGLEKLEGLGVAFDRLLQLVQQLRLAVVYASDLELVAACFGLRFLCPILSVGGTALVVTETLFCGPREATAMLLADR